MYMNIQSNRYVNIINKLKTDFVKSKKNQSIQKLIKTTQVDSHLY